MSSPQAAAEAWPTGPSTSPTKLFVNAAVIRTGTMSPTK
jgi:hypothetical protein